MSTSVRYTRLHDELHHVEDHPDSTRDLVALIARGRQLRNALTCLYASAMCLSLGGLLGFIVDGIWATSVVAALGIGLLIAACFALCIEAVTSFRILAAEADQLMSVWSTRQPRRSSRSATTRQKTPVNRERVRQCILKSIHPNYQREVFWPRRTELDNR